MSTKKTIEKPVNPNAEYIAEFWSDTITPEMQVEMEKERVKNDWPDYGSRYQNLILNKLVLEPFKDDNRDRIQKITKYFNDILGTKLADYNFDAEFIAETLLQIELVLPVFNPEFTIDVEILETLAVTLYTWLGDELDPERKLNWYYD